MVKEKQGTYWFKSIISSWTEIRLILEYRNSVYMFFCFSIFFEVAVDRREDLIVESLIFRCPLRPLSPLLFWSILSETFWFNLIFCVCYQFHLHVLKSDKYWSNSSCLEKEVNGQLKTADRWMPTRNKNNKTRSELKTLGKLVHHITTELLRPFNAMLIFHKF